MINFIDTLRFAWRSTLKQPALSILIVLTLALGIGANTAMFSAAWEVMAAPLPYAEGDQLILIKQNIPGRGRIDAFWSLPTFQDVRAQSNLLADVAGYEQQSLPIVKAGEPVSALTGIVSANFFDVLGVSPMLGRNFASNDDAPDARPVMLLSQRFWAEAFNSDPSVIGTAVDVYGLQVTIIGVLPALPPYPKDNDIWVTHASNVYTSRASFTAEDRTGYWFEHVLARMQPGVALAAVSEELDVTAARLEQAYPDIYLESYSLEAVSLQQEVSGEAHSTFLLLQVMTLLVLLIASANVGNLTFARLSSRQQELAIKEAVGASPTRLRLQLLVESTLMAMIGGSVGLLLAWSTLDLLQDFTAQYTPMASEMRLDGVVLAFAVFITLLSGFLSGVAPAFVRRDINAALKEGGDKVTSSRALVRKRQSLLALQYALAFVVLTSAGLVSLSFHRLTTEDAGYDAAGILAISLLFRVDMTQESEQFAGEIERFSRALMSRVTALPAVESAGFYGGLPLLDNPLYELARESFEIEGGSPLLSGPHAFADVRLASGSYFSAMNIPLLHGRLFNNNDGKDTPLVAIVNSSFAKRYFVDGDAIGKRVKSVPYGKDWLTIVGVVNDVRGSALHREEGEVLYFNYDQSPGDLMNLYVKATGNLPELGQQITNIIHELSPTQPVDSVRALSDIRRSSLAPATLRTLLVALFGLLSLVVTLTGVAGVVSNHIRQQRRETAIRAAMGATPRRITLMFIQDGLRTYAAGLFIGLLLMLLLSPMLQSLLYSTTPFEPAIYLTSAALLTLAIALVLYPRSSKASAERPMDVLHEI